MDRSIYTALNSMQILRTNQSVTSQNLANSSSTGFQKDISTNFASVYLDRSKGLDPRVMALQDAPTVVVEHRLKVTHQDINKMLKGDIIDIVPIKE